MKIYSYRVTKEKVKHVRKYKTFIFNRKAHYFVVMPIGVIDFFVVNKFYKYCPSLFSTLKPLSKRQKLILMRKSSIKKAKVNFNEEVK